MEDKRGGGRVGKVAESGTLREKREGVSECSQRTKHTLVCPKTKNNGAKPATRDRLYPLFFLLNTDNFSHWFKSSKFLTIPGLTSITVVLCNFFLSLSHTC